MTLARGTDRLESARLVLRRITPEDLPFFECQRDAGGRLFAPGPSLANPVLGCRGFETELGYRGQGFATETAGCVREYARDVLRLPYTISAILPQNARSRRVAERSGARAAGQMDVVGLTWDRYLWPLATGGAAQIQPASTQ